MNNKLTWVIVIVLVIAVIIGGFVWLQTAQHAKAAKLQSFASCIKDRGALFYGAFWCPHCQEQKAMFNTLFETGDKNLSYIECSTPDARGQLEVCNTEAIKTYPTWKFTDGSKIEGEATLQQLAEKTGCQLP